MFLEDHFTRIQKIIKEKLGELPKNTIHNEVLMRTSFSQIYQRLPRVIRIAVSEQRFVEFCMVNRVRLLNFSNTISENVSTVNFTDSKSKHTNKKNNHKNNKNITPTTNQILLNAKNVFLPTYSPDLILVRGKNSRVWDSDGNEYIDFGSGISVNSLGHNDSDLQLALHKQAKKIWHTTNLYLTEPSIKLATCLVEETFADRVFFCNSGAEANEAAIKIARKSSSLLHHAEKREILTFEGSFHGRTLTTITASAQTKYQLGFDPLPQGFRYCPFNDFEAASEMIGQNTCAVMIEPIQGEGGVNPAKPGFLRHIKNLCEKHNALLILDEIQCGMGRTGKLFSYQWEEVNEKSFNIAPDILTMAKALGGGLPIGAMLCTEKVSQSFKPGDHGTTFGGNPIVTAVALEAFKKINKHEMFTEVLRKGNFIKERLHEINNELNLFKNIRGRGLMVGAVLTKELENKAQKIINECKKQGLLILSAGPNVIRFLPPLNISQEELEQGIESLCLGLKNFHALEISND